MGRKTVSEEIQNRIRKLHLQGCKQKDIADDVGLSVKTVREYIKKSPELPILSAHSEDTDLQINYTTIYTRREEEFVKKYEKEADLYEDDVEGWTYHLTYEDERIKQQSLWWNCIIYPDSAPTNFIELLQATHMQIAISPLHDKDFWDHDSPAMVDRETGAIIPKGSRYKAGDRKKPHFHCIVKSDVRVSWNEMNSYLQNMLCCPYIQKCRSLKGSFDYFLHINNPEKYQGYFKKDIVRLNGFVVEANKYEQSILYNEVVNTIRNNDLTTWNEVFEFYDGQTEYILVITNKPGAITSLLHENWHRLNPNGRVQRVRIET